MIKPILAKETAWGRSLTKNELRDILEGKLPLRHPRPDLPQMFDFGRGGSDTVIGAGKRSVLPGACVLSGAYALICRVNLLGNFLFRGAVRGIADRRDWSPAWGDDPQLGSEWVEAPRRAACSSSRSMCIDDAARADPMHCADDRLRLSPTSHDQGRERSFDWIEELRAAIPAWLPDPGAHRARPRGSRTLLPAAAGVQLGRPRVRPAR